MTTFNQQGQHVNNQYNAAGDISFGPIHNRNELVAQLGQLSAALEQAIAAGQLDPAAGAGAKEAVEQAARQAGNEKASKSIIVSYLTKAKEILNGITAAGGLVQGIKHLIQAIGGLFV